MEGSKAFNPVDPTDERHFTFEKRKDDAGEKFMPLFIISNVCSVLMA
jgi:hypothetical protein